MKVRAIFVVPLLFLCDATPASAQADPITVGALVLEGFGNLKKWQDRQNWGGMKSARPGPPVQFINFSSSVVDFKPEGATVCHTMKLQPKTKGYCNTPYENVAPFNVSYSVAGVAGFPMEVVRPAVVIFVDDPSCKCVLMKRATEADLEAIRAQFAPPSAPQTSNSSSIIGRPTGMITNRPLQ